MTEPVTLTCPGCGHEFPVHVAYGDPETIGTGEDEDEALPCGCWAERARTVGHEPWCDYHD